MRACCVIALLFLALAAAVAFPDHGGVVLRSLDAAVGIAASQEGAEGDSYATLAAYRRQCPLAFNEEIIDLSSCSPTYVNSDGSIVGFSRSDPAQQAFSAIAKEMQAKGWTFVESGSPTIGSFVKETGRFHWAYVACFSVAGQTSVVVQTIPSDEEDEPLEGGR